MSLPQGATFASVLETQLHEARLPSSPGHLIGKKYCFGARRGSHHSILAGTVQAIQVSDTGGLALYVSNPLIMGLPLVSLNFNPDHRDWSAYVVAPSWREGLSNADIDTMSPEEMDRRVDQEIASRFIPGEFELI